MLKILEDLDDKVLISVGIVELTKGDWEKLTSFLERKVQLFGTIHWYLEIEDFRSNSKHTTPVDDLFIQHYKDHLERIALVGNKECHGWMSDLVKPFTKAEIRFFKTEDQNLAHEWIRGSSSNKIL